MQKHLPIYLLLLIPLALPLIRADCNIDSAATKTYSTTDGQVIAKVAVTASFRLGCTPGSEEPKLHAETGDGQYLAVTASNDRHDYKSVSFIEEAAKSKSRWIEIKIYDDATYQKLSEARQSGSSISSYQPMKTISISHYGVYGGPLLKMETVATVALIGAFLFAQSLRNKIGG